MATPLANREHKYRYKKLHFEKVHFPWKLVDSQDASGQCGGLNAVIDDDHDGEERRVNLHTS